MTASFGVAMLLRGSVAVGGTTACPDPAAVQSLISKASPGQPQREPDHAELTPLGGRLMVRLLDNRGGLLAERQLDAGSSCDGMAAAAAAVIGAMELEVWAVSGVEEVPVPQPEAPAVAARGVSSAPPNPSHGRTAISVDVGAALLGADDSNGQLTGVGALTVGLGLPRSAWRLEMGLLLEGPRSMELDDGKVSYQRFWAAAGLGYQLKWGRFSIEPQLGLLAAWLTVNGDGVTSFASQTALDLGGQAGLTAQWSFGGRAIWAGVFVLGWTRGTQVQIGGPGQARALPPWGALAGMGMRLGIG